MAELTNEQKGVLKDLLTNLGGRTSESFSKVAKIRVEVKYTKWEIEDYQKFIEYLPHFTAIGIFGTELSKDQILIDAHPSLSYYLLDKLLGGKGEAGIIEGKKMTEIERVLFQDFVFAGLTQSWEEGWENITGLQLKMSLIRVESDPFLTRRMDGKFVHAFMECQFEKGKEEINVCIPHKVAEMFGAAPQA